MCISQNSFNAQGAILVCRLLGLPTKCKLTNLLVFIILGFLSQLDPRRLATSSREDVPVILGDVWRSGNEQSLIECSQAGYSVYPDCPTVAVTNCESLF